MGYKIILLFCFGVLFRSVWGQNIQVLSTDSFGLAWMKVYQKAGAINEVNLGSCGKCIFILKTNQSCLKCFNEIIVELGKLISPNDSLRVIALSLCDSSVIQMKTCIYENRMYMFDSVTNLFVFYRSSADRSRVVPESVFSRFDVKITPAILMQNGSRLVFLKAGDLYSGSRIQKARIRNCFFSVFR